MTHGPLTEPMVVTDIFASGLANVERLSGNCYRFTLYAEQRAVCDGAPERVVVCRLVMPADGIPQALAMAARALGPMDEMRGCVACVGELAMN